MVESKEQGKMVDNNPGVAGYRSVFLFMIGCAVVGLICSIILLKMNNKTNDKEIAA